MIDGRPARVVLDAERIDLTALNRHDLTLWSSGYQTGYVSGVERGREQADHEAGQRHLEAVRVVRQMARIDPHEERAARAAGRPIGSLSLAPIYLRDSDSQRWVVVTGKGIRDRLKAWDLPAVWSNTHRGCQIRTHHEADLRARCDASGVRLIDQRGQA